MEKENKDTRYFIDVDLRLKKILRIGSGDRHHLSKEVLPEEVVRIYLTKGQFNKVKFIS